MEKSVGANSWNFIFLCNYGNNHNNVFAVYLNGPFQKVVKVCPFRFSTLLFLLSVYNIDTLLGWMVKAAVNLISINGPLVCNFFFSKIEFVKEYSYHSQQTRPYVNVVIHVQVHVYTYFCFYFKLTLWHILPYVFYSGPIPTISREKLGNNYHTSPDIIITHLHIHGMSKDVHIAVLFIASLGIPHLSCNKIMSHFML